MDTLPRYTVTEIAPLGFGNPEAAISYVTQKETGELPDDVERAGIDIITSSRPLVDLTESDDGCIDGRSVMKITYVDIGGAVREVQAELQDQHERYKVAGGGYMTALAMEFAFHPPRDGIDALLQEVAAYLAREGIFCGMHSGDHQNPELGSTDCGANDKVLTIFENAQIYSDDIGHTAETLLSIAGATLNKPAQDYLQSSWNQLRQMHEMFSSSTGRSRYEIVMGVLRDMQQTLAKHDKKPLAVIKHLRGDHKEDFIVINYVAGKTFSQAVMRRELKTSFPDMPDHMLPQVFVVDVPRIIQLAGVIAEKNIAALRDSRPDVENPFEFATAVALQAGISYQLATACTLTDGSLRTFTIQA